MASMVKEVMAPSASADPTADGGGGLTVGTPNVIRGSAEGIDVRSPVSYGASTGTSGL